jgi:formylglycine-generating enzyme required for sulfatase activity
MYSGSNTIDEVAWYSENSNNTTHPVGEKKANELGIYDMNGNVWEWCSDRYGAYPAVPQTNPQGSSQGSYRVYRGGSWAYNASGCRVANRSGSAPSYRNLNLGFRLVLPELPAKSM